MSAELKTITVIGAGGKMGMRISANFQNSAYHVFYCENSPAAQQQITAKGRALSDAQSVVPLSDVVILAVPGESFRIGRSADETGGNFTDA